MSGASEQFLGMAGIDHWIVAGLSVAALLTAFISAVAGSAGGLILLAVMAFVFPPALLIPLHTIVQLGASGGLGLSLGMSPRFDVDLIVEGVPSPAKAGSITHIEGAETAAAQNGDCAAHQGPSALRAFQKRVFEGASSSESTRCSRRISLM